MFSSPSKWLSNHLSILKMSSTAIQTRELYLLLSDNIDLCIFHLSHALCSPFSLMCLLLSASWPYLPFYSLLVGLSLVSLLNPPIFSIDWSKVSLSPSSLAWDHIWQTIFPKLEKSLRKDFCPAWIWTALCIYSLDSHSLISHSLTLCDE